MTASRATRMSLVEALLAATPAPPSDVADDALLAAAQVMTATRAAILATAELDSVVDVTAGQPADPDQVAELAARQSAWHDALAAARSRVGMQRTGVAKLRAYRPRQP